MNLCSQFPTTKGTSLAGACQRIAKDGTKAGTGSSAEMLGETKASTRFPMVGMKGLREPFFCKELGVDHDSMVQ